MITPYNGRVQSSEAGGDGSVLLSVAPMPSRATGEETKCTTVIITGAHLMVRFQGWYLSLGFRRKPKTLILNLKFST